MNRAVRGAVGLQTCQEFSKPLLDAPGARTPCLEFLHHSDELFNSMCESGVHTGNGTLNFLQTSVQDLLLVHFFLCICAVPFFQGFVQERSCKNS